MDPAVRLLGTPAVLLDGGWRPLRANKSGALLSFAAHRGAPVRRAEVAALIWPDVDDSHAHNNLRQLLRVLSKGQLARFIDRDHSTIRATVTSDVQAFSGAEELGLLDEAVTVYGGPFLDGYDDAAGGEFESWVASERAALERRWRGATLTLIEAKARAGEHDRAMLLAERLLKADPFDEVGLRHAMRALAARGDPRGALQLYTTFRESLTTELGLDPEGATVSLAQSLRDGSAQVLHYSAPSGAVSSTGSAPGVGHAASGTLTALAPRVGSPRRLIGRAADVAAVVRLLLEDETRLVTVLAPGGMGKSALAASVADELAGGFADGVLVASLDRVEGPSAIVPALIGAAGIALDAESSPLDQLLHGLRGRQALVVLDGFEQHIEQVPVVDSLVRGCPSLKVLVTSRIRLRLSTEQVYELGPLETFREPAVQVASEPLPSGAAQLFTQTVTRVPGGSRPGQHALAQVERVCRAVGGSPLAILLVAGWLDTLTLDEIESKIGRDWELLAGDDTDLPARRSDVQAAIAETYDLLSIEDREAWSRLSFLPGTIDRSIAALVSGTGWRGLRRLADHAVLRHSGDRFELHELLARFGRDRAETGIEEAVMNTSLAVWSERLATGSDRGTGTRLSLHTHDLDQAMQAWLWAVSHDRWDALTSMVYGLFRASARGGRFKEFRTSALEAGTKAQRLRGAWRDRANARLLRFAYATSLDEYLTNLRTGIEMATRLGDHDAAAEGYMRLMEYSHEPESSRHYASAKAAFELADDLIGLVRLQLDRGSDLAQLGRYEEAGPMLHQCRELFEARSDHLGLARTFDALGLEPLQRGDYEEASRLVGRAREHCLAIGDAHRSRVILFTEALLAIALGPRESARDKVDALLVAEARFGDLAPQAALLYTTLHVRFAEHAQAVVEGRKLLEYVEAEAPTLDGLVCHDLLARALAGIGELPDAARHLCTATAYTRALRAPRFVPHLAFCAARLAMAVGDDAAAGRLARAAAAHPLIDPTVREDVERTVAGTAFASEPSTRPGAPDDEILAMVEDVHRRLLS